MSPTPVVGLTDATAISAGDTHACALIADGTVRCWGANNVGELGGGTLDAGTEASGVVPVTVAGLSGVIAIAAGGDFTCALLSDRTVACWGDNGVGELGGGTEPSSSTPIAVAGVRDAVAVAAGLYNGCAALASGRVQCWGDNSYGELGTAACPNSTNSTQWCPRAAGLVPGVDGAIGVAAGNLASCAWLSTGAAECWGLNIGGYLGNGTGAVSDTWGPDPPGSVHNLSDVVTLALGQFHGCALTSSGSVWCWGENHGGQIGNGSGPDAYAPVSVSALSDVTAIGVGGDHTCAIVSGRSIVCWGANSKGELGAASSETCGDETVAGTVPCSTTPISVPWAP